MKVHVFHGFFRRSPLDARRVGRILLDNALTLSPRICYVNNTSLLSGVRKSVQFGRGRAAVNLLRECGDFRPFTPLSSGWEGGRDEGKPEDEPDSQPEILTRDEDR